MTTGVKITRYRLARPSPAVYLAPPVPAGSFGADSRPRETRTMLGRRISDTTLIAGAPAKVNLYLQVLGRRDDGYHDINSLMITVSLFDRLTVTRTERSGVTIEIAPESRISAPIPCDSSNLIAKAYQALVERHPVSGGLAVTLEKNIPVAAGLAGGSSDAATTLAAVNELFALELDDAALAEIGLAVGSDIPFFFGGGRALVMGRGEVVIGMDVPDDFWLVLVTPRLAISTAESYAALGKTLTNPKRVFTLPRCRTVAELVESLRLTGNDFEEVHLKSYPELGRIKDGLLQSGAHLARLSGSGPTVFGLFSALPMTEENGLFDRGDWHVSTVRPVALPIREFH